MLMGWGWATWTGRCQWICPDVTGYVNFEVQGGNQSTLLWEIHGLGNLELSSGRQKIKIWSYSRRSEQCVAFHECVCACSIFNSRLPGSFWLWHAVSSDGSRIYGKEDFLLKDCVCQGCLHWQEQKPKNCSEPGKSTRAFLGRRVEKESEWRPHLPGKSPVIKERCLPWMQRGKWNAFLPTQLWNQSFSFQKQQMMSTGLRFYPGSATSYG